MYNSIAMYVYIFYCPLYWTLVSNAIWQNNDIFITYEDWEKSLKMCLELLLL